MILTNDDTNNVNLTTTLSSTRIVNPPKITSTINDSVTAVIDSGATSNYLRPEDHHCATDITTDPHGPEVTLPNATTIRASKRAQLPISSQLSADAQRGHILPGLKSTSLVSVGRICDDDCNVLFRRKRVHVIKDTPAVDKLLKTNKSILEGKRNFKNGLWDITLNKRNLNDDPHQIVLPKLHGALYPKQTPNDPPRLLPLRAPVRNKLPLTYNNIYAPLNELIDVHECDYIINQQLKSDRSKIQPILTPLNEQVNVILRKDQHKKDLAAYLHGCCLWPVKSTFLKAIKNNHFHTWPGLDTDLIQKHLDTSPHTVKGHLKQEKQGLQSTGYKDKLKDIAAKLARLKADNPTASFKDLIEGDIDIDFFPTSDKHNERTNCIFYAIVESSPTGLGYFDTTGRFPYKSARQNEYILVAYNYDANSILAEPIPNRKAHSMTSAWEKIHNIFQEAGVAPNTYILDNEFSKDMRTAFNEKQIHYTFVPPHNHRANAAERAIQTFKNHFIAGLSGLDPNFPIKQ